MKRFLAIIQLRPRLILAIVLLFLFQLLLLFYIEGWQRPRLASLQESWFEKRKMTAAGDLRDRATIYRHGQEDLATFRRHMPPRREFARIMSKLYSLAAANDLSVGGVTYKPAPVDKEKLLTYGISFTISGSYGATRGFISDVQRLSELVIIDSLALNGKTDEDMVDLRLQITIYLAMEGR
jgi:type IV pilus assembly protein PilO